MAVRRMRKNLRKRKIDQHQQRKEERGKVSIRTLVQTYSTVVRFIVSLDVSLAIMYASKQNDCIAGNTPVKQKKKRTKRKASQEEESKLPGKKTKVFPSLMLSFI
jgi:hypothetical protein